MNDGGGYYIVCDRCAHVETRPGHADEPARCEACGSVSLWRFSGLHGDQAEAHSQLILERKRDVTRL